MKKKIATLCLMGLGVLAVQGCSVEAGDEGVATAQDAYSTCMDAQGAKATQAALAVAMADELGRWDPLNDLVIQKEGWFNFTRLSSSAVCLKNGCAMTKAILGQQNFTADQNVFNADNFRSTVEQGFGNERNLIDSLKQNNRSELPPAHKLTKVHGPKDLGVGACGAHYVFQVDHLDGTPLTAAETTNMQNTLCFFGQNTNRMGCGSNQFIGFATSNSTAMGCPTGRTCVAIDPDPNDNGTSSTTTSGAGPVYPMNRIYDPSNSLQGSSCTTTTGKAGKMQSKCSAMPSTCGYQYCIANP